VRLEVEVHHRVVDAGLLQRGAEFLAAHEVVVFQPVVAGKVVVVVGDVAVKAKVLPPPTS
jgi:hypothetical protein